MNRINNVHIPPHSAVGYLAMHWSTGGWAYGSGALIDDRHVLTCAHNLVDKHTDPAPRGEAVAIRFYQAYNEVSVDDPPPGGVLVHVGFYAHNYRMGQDAWDVGICRLTVPVVPPHGPFAYFTPVVTGNDIRDEEVNLTGYPGNRDGEMWQDRDQVAIVDVNTNTILYTHDTWAGNSGSPTWNYHPEEDRVYQHAIHVSRQAQELRRGLLITQPVFDWIEQAKAQPNPALPGFHLVGL